VAGTKSPKLTLINDLNREKVYHFISSMAPSRDIIFRDGNLWPLVETCAATFIQYFPRLIDDYGVDHILVRRFKEHMSLNHITIDEIRLWSDQISSHMLSNHLRGEIMNSTVDEKVLKSCEDTQRLLRNVMVLLHCNYHSPHRFFIGEKPSS
jgi:hypothetical protein